MWVKICGNTNLEDALLASQLGADAVGFVFAESKRQVTAAQVAAITPHLPVSVERVGVFCTTDADEIARTASDAGLTAVQLHGEMDERLLHRLAERFSGSVRIIQVLHWPVEETLSAPAQQALASQLQRLASLGLADRVLIDSKIGDASGGTGIAYDWSAAQTLFASAPSGLHMIAAGGLTPRNVGDAIARLKPFGVDVSSGVETSPGRKDPALLKLFLESARGTEKP